MRIKEKDFISFFENNQIILTEGAVGLRLVHEFGITPDEQIHYAGLMYDAKSRKALESIYREYLKVAEDFSLPILLMTNTRRANKERMALSAYKEKHIIADYAVFLRELAEQYRCPVCIGGTIGSKGDGYSGQGALTVDEAILFHEWQVEELKLANIDFIFQSLMPSLEETIGLSSLINRSGIPYIVSFMLRRSGKIPGGHTLHEAISTVDNRFQNKPICYMTNCVHPAIVKEALRSEFNQTPIVKTRFKGIQANAACAEPDELDCSCEIKSSGAFALASDILSLREIVSMKIYGGCCGTNETHIRELARQLCFNTNPL